MADHNDSLPEGTDSIVTGSIGTGTGTSNEDSLIMKQPTTSGASGGTPSPSASQSAVAATPPAAEAAGAIPPVPTPVTGSPRNKALDTLRTGGEKLSGQAADKARGLVGQGLERGSEALANVSKLIGDTATGLDDRLGTQYGDYARKAASTIEDTANKLASKDADELIEDTRGFVRKSPGIALAGAAVVGFALVRLVKSGLDQPTDKPKT